MFQVTIRHAGHKDVELLVMLGYTTFHETFAPMNDPANMLIYLSEHYNPTRMMSELQDERNVFIIAESDGAGVAYAKLCRGSVKEGFDPLKTLEIERIYVLQQYQAKKVGKALMEYILKYAAGLGIEDVWLGVWEHNDKAISFYEHCGFEVFGSHDFVFGNEVQNDLLMKKKLL